MTKIKSLAPMPPEVKSLWVEALRSGRFTQGQSSLGLGVEERCCLGVLAQVIGEAGIDLPGGWKIHVITRDNDMLALKRADGAEEKPLCGVLPMQWQQELGLAQDIDNEMDGLESVHDFLINRNDGMGLKHWDFGKIANWIEETL